MLDTNCTAFLCCYQPLWVWISKLHSRLLKEPWNWAAKWVCHNSTSANKFLSYNISSFTRSLLHQQDLTCTANITAKLGEVWIFHPQRSCCAANGLMVFEPSRKVDFSKKTTKRSVDFLELVVCWLLAGCCLVVGWFLLALSFALGFSYQLPRWKRSGSLRSWGSTEWNRKKQLVGLKPFETYLLTACAPYLKHIHQMFISSQLKDGKPKDVKPPISNTWAMIRYTVAVPCV